MRNAVISMDCGVRVFEAGRPTDFDANEVSHPMQSDEVPVIVNLGEGSSAATARHSPTAPRLAWLIWNVPNLQRRMILPASDCHGDGITHPSAFQPRSVRASNTAPSAGGDGAQTVCANSGSIDLFGLLQGTFTAGGDWIDDDACGQLNGSLLNTNGLAIDSDNFTYAVDGNGQCPADSAQVIITIGPQLNAGATTFQNLCGNDGIPSAV